MKCRHDIVLLVMASGIMLTSIGVITSGVLMPLGMVGWMLSLHAFWYGVPLAIIFATCAAIIYFADQRRLTKRP